MADVREEIDDLLDDSRDWESPLRSLLELDAKSETWTFDDAKIDSGRFGELVSRGIVEKVDGEYRLTDPSAIRAALDGEEGAESASATIPDISIDLTAPPGRVLLSIIAALAVVAAFRLIVYQSVFRAEHVVLLGNDPYLYRHWLFLFIDQGTGLFSLPEAARVGEPLLLATLLATTNILGGTTRAANLVLAWYPVVAGLITAFLVYILTVRVTDDRRVGLAAVVLLAVTPVHAYRTAIGFADHHAFDYLWLAVTVVAAVSLLQRISIEEATPWFDSKTLVWVGVLSIGIAAQVLAWNAGPLLLLPLAVYGLVQTAASVEAGRSPASDLPLVAGVTLAAALALGVHFLLDWQLFYIVVTPLLLAFGLIVIIGVGEVAHRRGASGTVTLGGLIAAGIVVFAVAYVSLPEFAAQFSQELVRLFVGGTEENIAETASLFSPRYGTLVGPFFFFGLSLFFALPYLVWSLPAGWSREQPALVLVGSYGLLLFTLSLLQVRFAGALALFVALFGGLAVVHLTALVGVGERPTILSESEGTTPTHRTEEKDTSGFTLPNRDTVVAVSLIFLLVGGLGAVMTPLRTNLLTVSDESYDAAIYMEDYSENRGWEYPQNYVFSEWGETRMYNAFVNGHSREFGFAMANYGEFLQSADSERWYQKLHDRTGFIVVSSGQSISNETGQSMYHRLQNWGSSTGHYRAIYASEDKSKKVFTLVPGAILTGKAEPNTEVSLSTNVSVAGSQFEYHRTVNSTDSGWYAVRVPYAGSYGSAGSVSEKAIRSGSFTSEPDEVGYLSMDAGEGDIAFDETGGNPGTIEGATWTEGYTNSALRFEGSDRVKVVSTTGTEGEISLSFWVKAAPNQRTDFPRLVSKAPTSGFDQTDGYQVAMMNGRVLAVVGNGSDTALVQGPNIADGRWHHIQMTWENSSLKLYVDGETVGKSTSFTGAVDSKVPLTIGAAPDGYGVIGKIDEVEFRHTVVNETSTKNVSSH